MVQTRRSYDPKVCPADYAELYSNYYTYVVGLVRRLGIDDQNKEDVASEILLRFYERDFLSKFDPELVFEFSGEKRPARFQSFLSNFVAVYCRHHRDRQQIRARREPLWLDSTVGDSADPWLDVFGPPLQEHDYAEADAKSVILSIREYLASVPRAEREVCDLVAFYDAICIQMSENGKIVSKELQEKFGVSSTTISNWLKSLRVHILASGIREAL